MKDQKNQTFTSAARPVVIYDGACAFCRSWAARLRRRDAEESLELVPFQDPSVAGRFPGIQREAVERALHLVAPDGTVREGAGALEEIANLLPAGRRFAWLFRLPFARSFAGALYRVVARHRHRLAGRSGSGEPPRPERR